jgi:hypothetical protein
MVNEELTKKIIGCAYVVYNALGGYFADLVVEESVICELKVVDKLSQTHEVQLVNYLVSTGIDVGLLINFGESVIVHRKYRVYKKSDRISGLA